MSKSFNIQLVGYTDVAGKSRNSINEDCIYMSMEPSDALVSDPSGTPLPDIGVVMAVADGISGLKHGEIASRIAVDTLQEYFRANLLDKDALDSPAQRRNILQNIIGLADKRIKAKSDAPDLVHAMGSTLVVAWLYADTLVVSWIGDSRAYIYSHRKGLELLTRDHTSVQQLVDSGEITYEQAFSYPGKEIVTRLLGDPTQSARPESVIRRVSAHDVILLCTDGLTGVLRDRPGADEYGQPFPENDIETIMRQSSNIAECTNYLWTAARRGGWHDNVSTILCRVLERPSTPDSPHSSHYSTPSPHSPHSSLPTNHSTLDSPHSTLRWLWLALPLLLAALLLALIGIYFSDPTPTSDTPPPPDSAQPAPTATASRPQSGLHRGSRVECSAANPRSPESQYHTLTITPNPCRHDRNHKQ